MKIKLLIIIIICLLVVSAIIVFLNKKKSTSLPSATTFSEPNKLLATVGDHKIYTKDLRKEAERQYSVKSIDDKTLQSVLNNIEEKEVIDYEAKLLNITVSDQELETEIHYKVPSLNTVSDSFKESVKYDLLKDKITTRQVDSRTAYTIGFWIPPYDSDEPFTADEKAQQEAQRQAGIQALEEIKQRLKANEDPLTVAESIYTEYPVLQSILAMNGYRLANLTDKSPLHRPKVYTYITQNGGLIFYDNLFDMKVGEVRKIPDDAGPGSGGSVAKMMSLSHSQFKTYESWLSAKKKELIK